MKKMMRVFFVSVLCGILPMTLLFGGVSVSAYTGSSSQTTTAGADIRVMSYNTLVDNDEANGGWSWGKPLGDRAEKAAAAINYYKPDVIGLQENNYNWHVALRALLPDYDYVNANVPLSMPLEKKESLGKKDWMCTTMMYNTKTLELVDRELYGYSCNYWGCIQRMRYVSMVLFKVKATGEQFVFISTHFDAEKDTKGQKMRRTQAGELAEAINYYKETYGCPVISTGDYNSGYSDEPVTIVREQAGMTSHPNNRGGIDYVLYSEGVTPKYFTVVNDADISGASDHYPIFADLALDNGFSFPTTTVTTVPTESETTTTTSSSTNTTNTTASTTSTTRSTVFRPTISTKNDSTTAAPTTAATEEKPIATQPTVTEDPSVAVTDATGSQTAPTVADGTAPTVTEDPETDASATVTESQGASVSSTTKKATKKDTAATGKDDDDDQKGGNSTRTILLIGAGLALIGVFAAVAAVLIRKKQ